MCETKIYLLSTSIHKHAQTISNESVMLTIIGFDGILLGAVSKCFEILA